MAVVLALPLLFDQVEARFADEGADVPMTFGWREPGKQKTSPLRIVWVPGDPQGNAGELVAARNPGRLPRPIGTLAELFHARIEAVDPLSAEDERVQYQACRELFDAWWRAVYLAARGTVALKSLTWDTSKKERRHGNALVAVCTLEAMVPDAPAVEVIASGRIESSLLDVTETIETDEAIVTETGATLATEDDDVIAAANLAGTETVAAPPVVLFETEASETLVDDAGDLLAAQAA